MLGVPNMLLLDKYRSEIKNIEGEQLLSLFEGIHVVHYDELFTSNVDPKNTILIGEQLPLKEAFHSMQQFGLRHVVQTNRKDFFFDIITSCLLLKRPKHFQDSPIPFFVNNFEGDPNHHLSVRSEKFKFFSTHEKAGLLSKVESFLTQSSKTENFKRTILLIADEMITNALFNAPIDIRGFHIHQGADRAKPVSTDRENTLLICHDSKRLIIGVTDGYGSVGEQKVLTLLENNFRYDKSSPREQSGGAGLGCKMMVDHCSGFYMIVQRSKKTLVCCALPIGVSSKQAELLPKNLHFCFF